MIIHKKILGVRKLKVKKSTIKIISYGIEFVKWFDPLFEWVVFHNKQR